MAASIFDLCKKYMLYLSRSQIKMRIESTICTYSLRNPKNVVRRDGVIDFDYYEPEL